MCVVSLRVALTASLPCTHFREQPSQNHTKYHHNCVLHGFVMPQPCTLQERDLQTSQAYLTRLCCLGPGDAAAALNFISSDKGKEAYSTHLEERRLLWTFDQVQEASVVSRNLEEWGGGLAEDVHYDEQVLGVVEGKRPDEVSDFCRRYKNGKR